MRAMILAAGLGKRMRPLTEKIPKPLLKVNDKPLIEHLIVRLVEGGITGVVVNHYYLGEMIEKVLGDGARFGIEILYSKETALLETGGGVINSLGKLKDESFIVVNADIWTDFNFASLKQIHEDKNLAHLILVENVAHNLKGDFYINKAGLVSARPSTGAACLTFSGISVLHRKLFEGHKVQSFSFIPLLQAAMADDRVTGEIHNGVWIDVGTPERLDEVISLTSQIK